MKIKRNQKGFTLIEVVLVLAIGGLIFLLAFLAFQQVSRNRRDTQRRSDAGRIAALYNDVVSDAGGNFSTATAGRDAWVAAISGVPGLAPPSGTATYTVLASGVAIGTATNNVQVTVGATSGVKCDGTTAMTSANQGKVEIKLESGVVCRNTD